MTVLAFFILALRLLLSYVYDRRDTLTDTVQRVDMIFHTAEGGSDAPDPSGTYYGSEQIDPYLNYYIGGLPQFYEGVHGYQRLTTKALYPSIDWQMYSDAGGPKYYYVVQPGGNPADILFQYQGADSTWSDSVGLHIATHYGSLTSSVTAYQGSTAVPISIATYGGDYYYFTVGTFDATQPLTIMVSQQPAASSASANGNLTWATRYGGTNFDQSTALDVDPTGNPFMTGFTRSNDFPITVGHSFVSGLFVGFVTKFNQQDAVVWSTVYGGTNQTGADMSPNAIAVGSSTGSDQPLYIAGLTSYIDMPVPPSSNTNADHVTSPPGGNSDAFVARFNGLTGSLNYGTYFGTDQNDNAFGLKLDRTNNNLFLVGSIEGSYTFKNNTGSWQDPAGTGILVQFDPTMIIQWSTGFGSSQFYYPLATGSSPKDGSVIHGVNFDKDGNLLISGYTNPFQSPIPSVYSITAPSTSSYTQTHKCTTLNGSQINNGEATYNAFIAKFTPSVYSSSLNTYSLYYWSEFGGAGPTLGDKICADNDDNIFLSGRLFFPSAGSYLQDFPTPVTGTFTGFSDVFLTKFSQYGEMLTNNIVPGSDDDNSVTGIQCDNDGNLYGFGRTDAFSMFPTTAKNNWYNNDVFGETTGKCFLFEYDNASNLKWMTLFGASTGDFSGGLSIYNNTDLYISGFSDLDLSPTDIPGAIFPIYGSYLLSPTPLFDNNGANRNSCFIARFDMTIATGITDISDTVMNAGIVIYPNPSSDYFNISLLNKDVINDIKLYDIMGRLITVQSSNSKKSILNCTSIPKGFYIIEVSSESATYTSKIVIK